MTTPAQLLRNQQPAPLSSCTTAGSFSVVGAQSEWRAGRCNSRTAYIVGQQCILGSRARRRPLVALGAGTAAPAGATPPPALSVSPAGLSFPVTTLGDFTVLSFTVTNTSTTTTDVVSGYVPSGTNPNDFGAKPGANCTLDNSSNIDLAPGVSCSITTVFNPGALGTRSATLTLIDELNPTLRSTSQASAGSATTRWTTPAPLPTPVMPPSTATIDHTSEQADRGDRPDG